MSYASTARQPAIDLFEYDPLTGAARLRGDNVVLPSSLFDADGRCLRFLDRLTAEGHVLPEDEAALREAVKALAKGAGRSSCELCLRTQRETGTWVRLVLSSQGAGLCAVGMAEDVTKQKETLGYFINESQFYQAVLAEQDAYGQVDVTENRIMRVGGMWNLYNELIDEVPYSALVAEFIEKVVHPEDRRHYAEIMRCENFAESFENGIERLGCEFRRIVDQNKMTWMRLSVHLFRDPFTKHVLALLYIKNIDDKKRQEILLLRDSTRDQLTNIYNKMMAQKAVSDYLAVVPDGERYAFVILDLDDFKDINDLQGHAVGDLALVRLANTLGRAFRKDDVIGRFGGDEFVILLKNIKSKEWVGERLAELADELRSDAELPLACSSGVVYAEGPDAYERLFRRADIALYAAKSAGKGRFVFADDLDEVDLWQKGAEGAGPASRRAHAADTLFKGEGPEPLAEVPASFDAFVGEQGDMAYLIDSETFDLVCGNKAFYDRLGLAEEQCQGMKCYEVTQKRDSPCPFCGKMNWSADKFYLWKNFNGALEQEFLMKNKLVSWQGREALLAVAVDVSNDKSIVDSLVNGDADAHSALDGVQRMSEARTLSEALDSALETVGSFFRADAVRFWRRCEVGEPYSCVHAWGRGALTTLDGAELAAFNEWLGTKQGIDVVSLESPEAALCESFDLYRYLKDHAIRNQRWISIRDKDEEVGYLSIDNISSNFQNVLFLDSFSTFFSTELNRRILVESTLSSARLDDLTNLLSRRSFEERLASYRADDVRSVGVLLANFNNLKGINSARGFRTGNYYLRQYAGMLAAAFSDFDVYRLNGDEFLALAANIGQADLDRAVRAVEESVRENGSFSVAVGSSWDDVENDLRVLIEQATRAMEANKALYYDTAADAEAVEHRKMLDDLIAALCREEFVVFFQPKVELECGQVMGAEALVRYQSEATGTVLPNQFIELLERNNLIRYIDLFVLETVCRQLECWKHAGLFLPVVSLNFSRLTLLERDIVSSVESIVSRYDVAKDRLEIEITESVADIGKNILCQTARDLYDAGYAISLDDFGTKYTNLSMLADVDFGVLKLDRSLVGALGSRTNYQAILKNIIRMCQDLVIEVIAEGVETHEQAAILRDLECKLGQGYLYGKPMPASEFERTYL